jgi:threonyl-tRNA synthetase
VRILPISESWTEDARGFVSELKATGLRATLEDRDSLSYRIREAELRKIPYMGVIGEREAAQGTVAVRKRGEGKKQEILDRKDFTQQLREEVRTRSLG